MLACGLRSFDAVPFNQLSKNASATSRGTMQLVGITWLLVCASLFVLNLGGLLDITAVIDRAVSATEAQFPLTFKDARGLMCKETQYAMAKELGEEDKKPPGFKSLAPVNTAEAMWHFSGDVLARNLIDSCLSTLGVDLPRPDRYDIEQFGSMLARCKLANPGRTEVADESEGEDVDEIVSSLQAESSIKLEVVQEIASDVKAMGKKENSMIVQALAAYGRPPEPHQRQRRSSGTHHWGVLLLQQRCLQLTFGFLLALRPALETAGSDPEYPRLDLRSANPGASRQCLSGENREDEVGDGSLKIRWVYDHLVKVIHGEPPRPDKCRPVLLRSPIKHTLAECLSS